MRQYKPLALLLFVLFLPVILIAIAEATKTAKPEYALHSDLEVVPVNTLSIRWDCRGYRLSNVTESS